MISVNFNIQAFLSIPVIPGLTIFLAGYPPLDNGSSGTTLHTVTEYHVPESVTEDSHF